MDQQWDEQALGIEGLSDDENEEMHVRHSMEQVPVLASWKDHPVYAAFLDEDFETTSMSKVLEASLHEPAKLHESLTSALGVLDEHIRQEVSHHLDELWSHSFRLHGLKDEFQDIRHHCQSLCQRFNSVFSLISNQYSEMSETCNQLENVSSDIIVVKNCIRFGQLVQKLKQAHQDQHGQSPKLAQFINEIHLLLQSDGQFESLEMFEKEMSFVNRVEVELRSSTKQEMEESFRQLDQASMGNCLQIYHNLGELARALDGFLDEVQTTARNLIMKSFEVSSLGVGSAKNEKMSDMKTWRSAFWISMDNLIEELILIFSRTGTLYKVVMTMKDHSSDIPFLEIFHRNSNIALFQGETPIVFIRWLWINTITECLTHQLENVFSRSSFARKVLINEFPRFLQIFNQFHSRLSSMFSGEDESIGLVGTEKEELVKCMSSYWSFYLSRCITTMNEPINLMFESSLDPHKLRSVEAGGRLPIPTKSDMKLFFNAIVSVLESVRHTVDLHEFIIKGVVSSIELFSTKSEELIDAINRIEINQKLHPPKVHEVSSGSEGYYDRLSMVFSMVSALDQSLNNLMVSEDSILNVFQPRFLDLVDNSRDSLKHRCVQILKPILDPSAVQLRKVLSSIYDIEWSSDDIRISPEGSDYIDKIKEEYRFIRRHVLSPFKFSNPRIQEYLFSFCRDFLHHFLDCISLIPSFSENGKLAVASDIAIIEDLIKRFLGLSNRQHPIFHEVEEFRNVLFMELGEVLVRFNSGTSAASLKLRKSLLADYLMTRLDSFPSPPSAIGWSIPQYLKWVHKHSETDKCNTIKTKIVDRSLSKPNTLSQSTIEVLEFLQNLL